MDTALKFLACVVLAFGIGFGAFVVSLDKLPVILKVLGTIQCVVLAVILFDLTKWMLPGRRR